MRNTYIRKDGRKFQIMSVSSNRCGTTFSRRSERKDGTWTDWYRLDGNKFYDFGERYEGDDLPDV